MSALNDYSKFDTLDCNGNSSSSDDDESSLAPDQKIKPSSASTIPQQHQQQYVSSNNKTQMTHEHAVVKEGSEVGRYVYECNGRKIYEWEQSLEEVNIYIDVKGLPNKRAADFLIKIQSKQLSIGLKGNDRLFIDEPTFSKVNTSESSWYLDGDSNTLHVILMKVHRGETWEAALVGKQSNGDDGRLVDPVTKEKIKQNLMRERFQEENPGFDFRDAQFNGEAPDPRTFMNN